MSREQTKSALKKIYQRALGSSIDPESLPDQGLIDAAGIDSISALEILVLTEQEFSMTFEDEDLSAALVDDLNYLIDYIERRQSGRSGSSI